MALNSHLRPRCRHSELLWKSRSAAMKEGKNNSPVFFDPIVLYVPRSHQRQSPSFKTLWMGIALLFRPTVWTFLALGVCVWREGPIISAVWEFRRHARSNLLFHSPGPLSSQSSFPVGNSSYPSTGKRSPTAASYPEFSSYPVELDKPFPLTLWP